ncbi:hypothetical protein HOY82DRAFT_16809 [Tuber indicum]|nr:hypothetical protein HOY82DRAFT_16809 [Tuber indicum]
MLAVSTNVLGLGVGNKTRAIPLQSFGAPKRMMGRATGPAYSYGTNSATKSWGVFLFQSLLRKPTDNHFHTCRRQKINGRDCRRIPSDPGSWLLQRWSVNGQTQDTHDTNRVLGVKIFSAESSAILFLLRRWRNIRFYGSFSYRCCAGDFEEKYTIAGLVQGSMEANVILGGSGKDPVFSGQNCSTMRKISVVCLAILMSIDTEGFTDVP